MFYALIIAVTCLLLGWSILYLALKHMALQVPASLLAAAGFALGVVLSTLLVQGLSGLGMGLRMATLVCVCLGMLAGAGITCRTGVKNSLTGFVKSSEEMSQTPLSLVMVLLMAASLLGSLVNNLIRPIFPWDAFTTWMYRSKAWALEDQITTMAFVPDWLAAGGESGYAIYAHHYPTALSVLAAMASALSGGWEPAAASSLWTFAGVALAFGVYGCCRWQGLPTASCTLASFMVLSAPLLTMHMALAGYGDSWMALYSGLGLALLLVGQTADQKNALIFGMLLLLLGTQIKTEGWIWFGVGLGFLVLNTFRLRFGGLWLAGLLGAAAALPWLTGITGLDLGQIGQWGIVDGALRAGPLGNYTLRPYNPLGDYGNALYQDNNFGLLPLLCTLGLLVMVLRRSTHAIAHVIMLGLIVASQLIIFGLSSFSEYAETGTAINRLIIHFLPVFALTAVTALDKMGLSKRATDAERDNATNNVASAGSGRLEGSIWFFGLLSAALLLVMALTYGPSRSESTAVAAAGLVPVVGNGGLDVAGRWQISNSPRAFAVLGSRQPLPTETRFADLTVVGERAAEVVFYWRNATSTDLNSVAIPKAGRSLIDLQDHPNWDPGNATEWGFVIPEVCFDSVAIGDVALSSALEFSNLPGLLNRWLSPPMINQRTLNNLTVTLAGPSVLSWLTLALGFIVLAALAGKARGGSLIGGHWGIEGRGQIGTLMGGMVVLAGFLWSQGFLRNAFAVVTHPERELVDNLAAGHEAQLIAEAALKGLDSNRATLVVPSAESEEFSAQKLPLLLLPQRAVFTSAGPRQVPENWTGQIMLLGTELERLDALEAAIEKKLKRPLVTIVDKEGFRLVE